MESTKLYFSEIESGITGLKISRCNSDMFDAAELYQQITANGFDLCRLKVPAEDEYAPHRLHQTGLPFFFSGSIRKYRTPAADIPPLAYLHPHLSFELYDGSQDVLLRQMLQDTWGNYPLGYYRSPYLSHLVTKQQEIESVYQYYKKHNLNSAYPKNKILFMKDGDNYVGIFTLNEVGNTLECNLAGILKPYRSGMYFHDEMNFKKEYCLKNGFEYFTFGARNENAQVQRIFQHLGFETAGSDNVFHITPLLTFSKIPAQTIQLNTTALPPEHIAPQLLTAALQQAKQHLPHYTKSAWQLTNEHLLANNSGTTIQFTFPVVSPTEVLVVLQSAHAHANAFTAYLRLSC